MHSVRALTVLVIAGLVAAPSAEAQQVLEIDTAAGRVIIDDEWRAIRTIEGTHLDRTRAILYATDDEEPHAVMAFPLEAGEWLRTIPTPQSDGPYELSQGMADLTVGRAGTLYVAGYVRVLEFDPLGNAVSNWRPAPATGVSGVCELDGQPAVVMRSGVTRRGANGTDERFGAPIVDRRATTTEETPLGHERNMWGSSPRIACADYRAYVVTTNAGISDSVFVYHRNGDMERLAVPTEFTDRGDDCTVKMRLGSLGVADASCTNWARDRTPTIDGHGNLVLLGRDQEIPGTIVAPDSGCYAVLRKPEPSLHHDALHIYQDSALVFHYATYQAELPPGVDLPAGTQVGRTISTTANRVSIHPLRRISGEPCPGMLESVR